MSEWLQLAITIIGSTTITGGLVAGISAWFKWRREDRKALEGQVVALQAKIESLLMDQIAKERETNAQMLERIAMDAKQNEVIAAATAALREASATIDRLRSGS